MDVNGTRMHLVLGREDWETAIVPPVDTTACFDERSHTIGLRPRPFVFPTRPTAERVTPDDRRGAAADRFGNVFWIGADRTTVLVQGAGRAEQFTWWPGEHTEAAPHDGVFEACGSEDLELVQLSGLAVTVRHHLVVGMRRPSDDRAGLLVFDLAGGGPPVVLWWPRDALVRPFDLAGLPGGGVAVLDVSDPPAPGSTARLWQLDEGFQVVDLGGAAALADAQPLFEPLEPGTVPEVPAPSGTPPAPLHLSGPGRAVVLPLAGPISVDALPDGSVLVLDREGADGHFEVSRWRCGERVPFEVRVDAPDDPALSFVCTDQRAHAREAFAGARGHDLVVLAPPETDVSAPTRLLVVDDRGDQAFELVVDETGADLVTDYHPLRLFGGVGLVAAAGVAHFESEGRWLPVPVQSVRRYEPGAVLELAPRLSPQTEPGPAEAAAVRGFDAGVPGTTWHRLVLDAVIPAGSSIEVESRAGDEPAALERLAWRAEPSPYLRGDDSEVPHHAYGPGAPGRGSWELLFQGAVGRYLQLRLTMRGDGQQGPRIWAVRAHFPRFSYLAEYLPDIYREDRDSASFLDRYLANVEGTYTTLEGRLASVQRLVDPSTIDADYLPWLASWVGAAVEPDWEPARVRLFVRHAARMFARRGTPRGMVEAIRLAIHPCPTDRIFEPDNQGDAFDVRIVEAFRTRAVPGVVFGNPADHAGPRLTPTGERWDLPDGRARLVQRWQAFRAARGASATDFPLLTPTAQADRQEWHDFVRSQLVPTYADVGSAADLTAFREFLGRRYRSVADYRAAWAATSQAAVSMEDLGWPTTLPPDGAPLQDWVMFVSAVLPAGRSAHRATVLVPIQLDDTDEERARRLGRVRRVVDVEAPAHTLVDVQPFWAALRVGEARVGLETIVGEGSRYTDMVLGRGRLAQAVLPGGDTWRLPDRVVVDRDRIKASERSPARTGATP